MEKFWKNYFVDSTISNYQDYTKKKYGNLCEELIKLCWILDIHRLLDYWCATGNLIKEFLDRWYEIILWTDISDWATSYAINNWLHKNVMKYNNDLLEFYNDFVFMLDVLEHIDEQEIRRLLSITNNESKIVFRLPVSNIDDGRYILDVSENDKTHIIRKTKERWNRLFDECWYRVELLNGKYIYDSEGVMAWVLLKKHIKWR